MRGPLRAAVGPCVTRFSSWTRLHSTCCRPPSYLVQTPEPLGPRFYGDGLTRAAVEYYFRRLSCACVVSGYPRPCCPSDLRSPALPLCTSPSPCLPFPVVRVSTACSGSASCAVLESYLGKSPRLAIHFESATLPSLAAPGSPPATEPVSSGSPSRSSGNTPEDQPFLMEHRSC